jgi:hypothetical protein
MKRKSLKIISLTVLILAASCDETETVVTNIVHRDGSVTRRIEMKSSKHNFSPDIIQVPLDSTWIMKDSISISTENDTVWFRTAEKIFKNADALNEDYNYDKGANRKIKRSAAFTKKFRWFNTFFTFSEKLDKSFLSGYPPEKFLSADELEFFYLPENISRDKLSGADSTKYKELKERTDLRSERYYWSTLVSEWIGEFLKLTEGRTGAELSKEALKMQENEIIDSLIKNQGDTDSLIARVLGYEAYSKFRTEADSATSIINERLDANISFAGYTVIFTMPGKVTASNGFIMKEGEIMWPVRSEFFLSEPYVMHAESKMPNIWAWFVSGFFLLFVVTGALRKINKKG